MNASALWHTYCYIEWQEKQIKGEKKMKAIFQNRTVETVTDFMDRVPGLISLTVTLIIVIGFIG